MSEDRADPFGDRRSDETHELRCADGWRLDVRVVAGQAPRAVAVCGHAMMVDRRTLDAGGDGLVSTLAGAGIAVVWPDLRGHGASGPRASAGGRWSYDDLVDGDAVALAAFARGRFPGLPVFAVGHSLFGHVALAHEARHPGAWDGLALLAANVWLPSCEPSPSRLRRKRAALYGMYAISLAVGRFPSRALGVGPMDEATPYVRQFVDWLRTDDWRARDGFSYRAALPTVRAPLLCVGAGGDTFMAAGACLDRFVAPVPDRQCVLAGRPNSRRQHLPPRWRRLALPIDPDHMELVTDARSRPVWRLVSDFVLEEAAKARRGS